MHPGNASMEGKESDLMGKGILITGAGRGIGAALAIRFAEIGARLCVNLFSPVKESEALVTQLTDRRSRFKKWASLSRGEDTDDICDAAVFLILDRASYISGTTLVVDGSILPERHSVPSTIGCCRE